jgi:hypothetical protein
MTRTERWGIAGVAVLFFGLLWFAIMRTRAMGYWV